MKVSINRVLGLAAFAALAGACSSQAAMQASFHLPVTAHWGKTILAPGDYKIETEELVTGRKQVIVTGSRQVIRTLPLAIDSKKPTGTSSLQLVQLNGDYFVREYRSDTTGKIYTFGVPKHSDLTKVVELKN